MAYYDTRDELSIIKQHGRLSKVGTYTRTLCIFYPDVLSFIQMSTINNIRYKSCNNYLQSNYLVTRAFFNTH